MINTFDIPKTTKLNNITVANDGKAFTLKPLDDLTPIENYKILRLLFSVFVNEFNIDHFGYIEENGLIRHFEEVK